MKTQKLPLFTPFALGTKLSVAARQAIEHAREHSRPVMFQFCRISVRVGPRSVPRAVIRRYKSQCRRKGERVYLVHKSIVKPATAKQVFSALKITKEDERKVRQVIVFA